MYMYMYIYMYADTIYTCTCTCTCTCTYKIYIYTYIYIYSELCLRLAHTCIHIHTHTLAFPAPPTYVHTRTFTRTHAKQSVRREGHARWGYLDTIAKGITARVYGSNFGCGIFETALCLDPQPPLKGPVVHFSTLPDSAAYPAIVCGQWGAQRRQACFALCILL
jgi:hypothetical protein